MNLQPTPIGALRVVQIYGRGDHVIPPPTCDAEGCTARSTKLWCDDTNKSFELCPQHEYELLLAGIRLQPNLK